MQCEALQRNFESISNLCMTVRADNAKLEAHNKQIAADNKAMATWLCDANEKISDLEKQIEDILNNKKLFEK